MRGMVRSCSLEKRFGHVGSHGATWNHVESCEGHSGSLGGHVGSRLQELADAPHIRRWRGRVEQPIEARG
eukprot:3812396-Prymnesium_polylepis.1